MKLLAILFCIAYTQANPINQYGSQEGESPWTLAARLQNANSNEYISLPSSQIGLNNFAVQSTPQPNFSSSDILLNQHGFSSTPAPEEEYPRLQKANSNEYINLPPSQIGLNSARNNFVVQSTPQPNFSSSDILLNQHGFSSTPAPEEQYPRLQNSNSNEYINLPPSQIGLISARNNFVVQSTPQPNFSSDIFLNQQSFSSTPAPEEQYPRLLQSNSNEYINLPSSQIGLNVQSTPQPNFSLSDIFLNQQGFSSTPAPENYPRFQFNQNPVTIKAITRGGYVDEAFGVSNIEEKPEISKNFYFFAAPEEQEAEVRPRIRYLQPNKKNVNVIFIKSPVQPDKKPIEVVSSQIEQDKTVVYVLVKKPDLNQEIYVKAAEPVKQPKPDVFFLKYHNEDEAQEAVKRVKDEHEHEHDHEESQERSNFPQVEINGLPEHFQNEVVNIGGNNLENDVTPSSILVSSSEAPFISEGHKK